MQYLKLFIPSVLIVLAVFFQSTASAWAYPEWPGTASAPFAPPNAPNLKVLVVGDSVAKGIGDKLQAQLAQLNYPATVYNEAIGGSSACQWRWYWFTSVLNEHPDADIIVAHFLGNQPCGPDALWTTPGGVWLDLNKQAVLSMEAEATIANKPIYWTIPGPSYYHCYAPGVAYVSSLWKYWAHWQESNLPTERQANLRDSFGGDTFIPIFHFSNGLNGTVRLQQTSVGTADCIHYTNLGYSFAANIVRAKIYPHWW